MAPRGVYLINWTNAGRVVELIIEMESSKDLGLSSFQNENEIELDNDVRSQMKKSARFGEDRNAATSNPQIPGGPSLNSEDIESQEEEQVQIRPSNQEEAQEELNV